MRCNRLIGVCLILLASVAIVYGPQLLAQQMSLYTVQFTKSQAFISEGGGSVTFTVELNVAPRDTVTVQYATHEDSAKADLDYVPINGTLVFETGEKVKEVTIEIVNDTTGEPVESAFIKLSNPTNASLGAKSEATITIIDDDNPQPTVHVEYNCYVVAENAGTLAIDVTLSDYSPVPVTVKYETADGVGPGAAIAGSEYAAASGTLTFELGETKKTIEITIYDDGVPEENKVFSLLLSEAVEATLQQAGAVVMILDEDPAPPAVTFEPNPVWMYSGDSAGLTVAIEPSEPGVTFTSTDPTVATVSGSAPDLTVSGVGAGMTQIQAILNDGIIASVEVYVAQKGKVPTAAIIDPVSTDLKLDHAGPINQIHNPSGIVIVAENLRDAKNAAIIKIEQKALTPADADPEMLEWTVKSVKDDDDAKDDSKVEQEVRAAFYTLPGGTTNNIGKTVYLHGVKEGRVRLEVWPKGVDKTDIKNRLDYYEAFVVTLKTMTFRVNLLSGPEVECPVTLEQAEKQVAFANIYLRQIGVELKPDDNETVTKEPAITEDPVFHKKGYFSAKVKNTDYVKNVKFNDLFDITTRVNWRAEVVQITFIDSAGKKDKPFPANIATLHPGNGLPSTPGGPNETLICRINADPSQSQKLDMRFAGGSQLNKDRPGNWGIILTGNNIIQATKFKKLDWLDQINGDTIAHELGHVMNLIHRAPANDGISQLINVMTDFGKIHPAAQPRVPMDFDVLQLKAARRSDALK